MIKAETIGNGVSISIDGDGETMQREFLGMWLREEMKHRECGRMLGQGMEPAPGTRYINNGMSGYHY